MDRGAQLVIPWQGLVTSDGYHSMCIYYICNTVTWLRDNYSVTYNQAVC